MSRTLFTGMCFVFGIANPVIFGLRDHWQTQWTYGIMAITSALLAIAWRPEK